MKTFLSLLTAISFLFLLPLPFSLASPHDHPDSPSPSVPLTYAWLLFPGFEPIDVFGPLDVLQYTAHNYSLTMHLLARTLAPVTTEPFLPSQNPKRSSFWPSLIPTHTLASPPDDIDVLLIPGGIGERAPDLGPEIEFVRRVFPRLKYLVTVCTGASIAARAGVLDGRRATTSKFAWGEVTPLGPNVKWVAPARWVVDGNIWSSSGVTSGMDLIYAFIKAVYPDGQALAAFYSSITEYEVNTNSTDEPFSAHFGIPTQNQI